MKNYLQITLIFVLTSLATSKEKPNIIVILSDDHRYDFMGFHSESPEWLETPNMDFLALTNFRVNQFLRQLQNHFP